MEPEVAAFAELAIFREATRVKRLAYTCTQAAQALGISTSTFERRILPFIETVQMDWGKRLIPIDELERFLAARRQQARAEQRPLRARGRKPGLPAEVVARIRAERSHGDVSDLTVDLTEAHLGLLFEAAVPGKAWEVREIILDTKPLPTIIAELVDDN